MGGSFGGGTQVRSGPGLTARESEEPPPLQPCMGEQIAEAERCNRLCRHQA